MKVKSLGCGYICSKCNTNCVLLLNSKHSDAFKCEREAALAALPCANDGDTVDKNWKYAEDIWSYGGYTSDPSEIERE